MKVLFAICMLVAATFVCAAESPAPVPPASDVIKGEVLEVLDAASFTYLRLKTKDGEFWASVAKAPVSKGAQVTLENVMVMRDFKSTSLNRTFPVILLGNLAGAPRSAPHAGVDMANPHAGAVKPIDAPDVRIPKAKNNRRIIGTHTFFAHWKLRACHLLIYFMPRRLPRRDRGLLLTKQNLGQILSAAYPR